MKALLLVVLFMYILPFSSSGQKKELSTVETILKPLLIKTDQKSYLYCSKATDRIGDWKMQRRVRDIMKIWYNAGPLGYPGDEDNGETSSWYVLSAMGFFPVCPGRPVYDIGSPIFDEVRLTLAEGKVFTIKARNVSVVNKYIQSATLNGKPLTKPWFEHKDMASGGTMVFVMGPRPNPTWGSAPEAVPPSMSQ